MAAAPDLVLHGATVIDADGTRPDAWVTVSGGVIDAIGHGDSWRDLARGEGSTDPREVVDLAGAMLAPGFIELHCHGGGGHSFEDGVDAIVAGLESHRRHGTTGSLVSLVTNRLDRTLASLSSVADLCAQDPAILGSHLEGPFISPQRLGAHSAQHVRVPTRDAIDELLAAARGTLRQVTLAPELPGGADAVQQFLDAGVTVAIGHTEADHTLAAHTFDRGARMLTHAFNAMPPIHHRAPGPVMAALDDERVVLELIADGIHVHHSLLRLVLDRAPTRTALITDAMSAACCGDGAYQLGSVEVRVDQGRAIRTDNGALAGSTITLDTALRTVVTEVGVDPVVAIGALTATPARVLGIDHRVGYVRPGFAADLVTLDAEWRVADVRLAGRQHA